MKMPFQKTTWENSIRANFALSISNVVLTIITAIAVSHALELKDRVVLTPPTINKQMWVEWNSADAEYMKSFGLYVVTLIGNITPDNADFVAHTASSFMDASIYGDVKKTILSVAQSRNFLDSAASSRFSPSTVSYEPETSRVFVCGKLALLTAGTVPIEQPLCYEMHIIIKNGKPDVLAFNSYDGLEPHDSGWQERHKTNANAK